MDNILSTSDILRRGNDMLSLSANLTKNSPFHYYIEVSTMKYAYITVTVDMIIIVKMNVY